MIEGIPELALVLLNDGPFCGQRVMTARNRIVFPRLNPDAWPRPDDVWTIDRGRPCLLRRDASGQLREVVPFLQAEYVRGPHITFDGLPVYDYVSRPQ